MIEAVPDAVGQDFGLMIDANYGFDSIDATRLVQRVEYLNLGWFEEPVPPEDLKGYLAVKALTTIPMDGGEIHSFWLPRSTKIWCH